MAETSQSVYTKFCCECLAEKREAENLPVNCRLPVIFANSYVRAALAIVACLVFTRHHVAFGGVLVSLDFNDITSSSISTTQYQTGNWLVYNATFGGWDRAGFNAAHALQLSGTVQGGTGDYALMIYGNNVATQKTGFAANQLGATYYVSYLMGPTVYSAPSEATQAGDTFRVNLLRADNTILAQNDVTPGAWAGVQTFSQQYFSYVGDGTGPVRMQLLSGNTLTRFAGAIDNVAIWDTVPVVPEPSTYAMALAGMACGVFAMFRRRKRGSSVGQPSQKSGTMRPPRLPGSPRGTARAW